MIFLFQFHSSPRFACRKQQFTDRFTTVHGHVTPRGRPREAFPPPPSDARHRGQLLRNITVQGPVHHGSRTCHAPWPFQKSLPAPAQGSPSSRPTPEEKNLKTRVRHTCSYTPTPPMQCCSVLHTTRPAALPNKKSTLMLGGVGVGAEAAPGPALTSVGKQWRRHGFKLFVWRVVRDFSYFVHWHATI